MNDVLSVNIKAMRYPQSKERGNLIENISFEAPPNSIISFIGRTGAGKTTLLRMIAGLEDHYQGEIKLDGRIITKPSREIQIIFQDYRLLPWKTVYENIEFATNARKDSTGKAQIEKWLEIVGLQARRDAWPKTLSGGETGRVAFARAFVDQPKVLLMDEPFRGVDLITKFDLQKELMNALDQQKTTVILVSHSIDEAVFLSDTIYVLADSPLSIKKQFIVDVPRPREQGDPRLGQITTEITKYLSMRNGGKNG